ncbi:hypothetical protein [Jiulongibacter sediminis]|uniref:Uncharacterized protein n=1 Tax=Jiulongibacter sediminis TaxID=1605367 RepID=A0A0P7BCW4_9BACT|nr:hypothetical protein [Jiulongibacter sediminis]KPM48475.1 hypothetical protein AFM12_07540 [Jiulongibacter sediminis]TBX25014.1 hypothetical protein TK44_07545 [Jiulongibacter sediminis]
MEGKAPIIKPEGMTIAKAWLLFLLLLVVYFISGIVAGYMMAEENKVDMTLTMAVVTLVGVIVISAVGLFINKWELPRFNGLKSTNLLYGITVGIIIRYISSIVEEVPLGLLDMELLHEFAQLDYLLIIYRVWGSFSCRLGL